MTPDAEPACYGQPEAFIDITTDTDIRTAVRQCVGCPVLAACKTMDAGEHFVGVWAGQAHLPVRGGRTAPIRPRKCAKCGEDFYNTRAHATHCQGCVRKQGPTCKDCGERPRAAWCGARCQFCYRVYDRERKAAKRRTNPKTCRDCMTPISFNATRCHPCDRINRKANSSVEQVAS